MRGSLVLARMSSGRRGSRFMKGTCAAEKARLIILQMCGAAQCSSLVYARVRP